MTRGGERGLLALPSPPTHRGLVIELCQRPRFVRSVVLHSEPDIARAARAQAVGVRSIAIAERAMTLQ